MARASAKRAHPAVVAFGIAGMVSAGVLGARSAGWLEGLELRSFDHYAGLSARAPAEDPRVALVMVAERDIQALGSYPVPDGVFARVLDILGEAGARAIAIDIYRDIPVPPGSAELDAAFASNTRVIALSKIADADGRGVLAPKALAGTDRVGFNNMVKDHDGVLRRGLLFMDEDEGGVGYSLALRAALLYLGDDGVYPTADDDGLLRLGPARFEPLTDTLGGYAGVDAGGYQYLLDWRRAPGDFHTVHLTELLSGAFDPEIFRDRIVIFGGAAESVPDVFRVPLHPGLDVAGATAHAYMASQIVRYARGEGRPFRALSDGHEATLVVFCAMLGAALMLWVRAGWGLALLGFGGLVAIWSLGWGGHERGWWMPVVPPAAAWAGSLSIVAAYTRTRERAERTEIMQLFSRHVTRQVAEDVWRHRDEFLEGGRPKPVRLPATILFIDIKGYTGTAEKMDPAELMEWIDEFLGRMAQEVLDRGGLVEDYFGDGMMAAYGIPIPRTDADGVRADANNAVQSALGMERTLRRLNASWREEGRPAIGIRVGICGGVVVAGSMGAANRLKYAVVGDAVVTAQRLESLGAERVEHDFKTQPCRILISEQTRAYLDPGIRTERVGEFVVKGKNEPVTVYRVWESDEAKPAAEVSEGEST